LVSLYSTIKMMHGPINIRFYYYQFVIFLYNPISLFTMTYCFHLDLSSSFAVIPNTLLLYKLITYNLSDNHVSWLRCYISSSYSFVSIHSIYSPPSAVFSGVPQGSVLRLHLFINYYICNSIKHSKYFLYADTIKIAHSISSATDSTLPQSDIDSIHSRCAAGLILMKLKSQVQCCLRIVLVNQNVGTHMYFYLLFVYH